MEAVGTLSWVILAARGNLQRRALKRFAEDGRLSGWFLRIPRSKGRWLCTIVSSIFSTVAAKRFHRPVRWK